MMSRILSIAPDSWSVFGAGRSLSPAAPESFGVRVQVQSVSGRPYVVLNAPGRPEYPDVFLTEASAAGACVQHERQCLQRSKPSPPGHHRAFTPPAAQQRSPEILSRHDPSSPVTLKRARDPESRRRRMQRRPSPSGPRL